VVGAPELLQHLQVIYSDKSVFYITLYGAASQQMHLDHTKHIVEPHVARELLVDNPGVYRSYHLKSQSRTVTYCCRKVKLETSPLRITDSPNVPCNIGIKVTLIARPLLMQVAQKCARANIVCSLAERVFILENCIEIVFYFS
jgi:hypothetical protein